MYIILSIICWIVTNLPTAIFLTFFLAVFCIGLMSQSIGEDLVNPFLEKTIPISAAASFVLSVIITIFVWNNYDEIISKGKRRWMSNLSFFQHRLGFSIATLVGSLLTNLFVALSVISLTIFLVNRI